VKFQRLEDKKLFLLELGRTDLLESVTDDWQPDDELVELFLKRRKKLIQRLKDFRRSQIQKANWRRYRWKYLKGIRRFHRSTKGKRFHRALGRFLATRIFRPSESLTTFEAAEALKALNSAKTHAYIELEYYMPLEDELDYIFFIEELVPMIDRAEKHLISKTSLLTEDKVELSDEDFEFLLRLVEPNALMKALAEQLGKEVEEVQRLWNKAKEIVEKEQGKREEESGCYLSVAQVFTKLAEGGKDE